MFIAKSYIKRISNVEIKTLRENFKTQMIDIIEQIIKDKPMFNKKDFSFYYFDDTTLNTTTDEYPISNLYIEINQPKNVKEISIEKKKYNVNTPELYFSLEEIKKSIKQSSVLNFDNNTLIWEDKFSINFAINVLNEESESKLTFYFRVIPCLTYKNNNNVNGIIYYNDNKSLIEIEYPKLSIFNYNIKNRETNGLYSDYVVMFKNFFKTEKKVKELPFEIFETLLYNIPNQFFTDHSQQNILTIINYMRNLSIKQYLSLDEQCCAFTSPYKSFSIIYAGHVINKLSNFIKKQTK